MDTNNQTTNPTPTTPATTPPQPQPAPTKTGGSNKMVLIIVGVLVVIILGLGGFILLNNQSNTEDAQISPAPTSANNIETSPSPVVSLVESDLLTYTSTDKKWQLMYPKDVTVEKREGTHIGPAGFGEVAMFYKHGPTQTTGTEFHDGLSVIVGTMKKPAATTLEKFADEQTAPNPEVGSTRTPFEAITVGGIKGISTITTGMATFKVIFLPIPGNTEAVYYISLFAEGADKIAYQAVTTQMLESFKLL